MHNNSDYYSNSLMIFVDPNSIIEGLHKKVEYFNLPVLSPFELQLKLLEPSMAYQDDPFFQRPTQRPTADDTSVEPVQPFGTDTTSEPPSLTGDETYSAETTKQTDGPKFGGFGGTGY